MYDLDTSLRILLIACVICIAFIVFEKRHIQTCLKYRNYERCSSRKPLPKEHFVPPASWNSMQEAPLQPVEASALESYHFGDIETAFKKILDKINTITETSMRFIEARDILNVVRKDLVARS